ncbi:MAG: transposase [Patescibacteria group bacterium]
MKDLKHRQSRRLPKFDYTTPGAYFVTICTHEKESLFGEIVNNEVVLNEIGKIIVDEWKKTAVIRPYINLDEFVVMPDHFHAVIWITNFYRRGTARRAPTIERFGQPIAGSIPTVIRAFKSAVTGRINIKDPLYGKIWQHNYYEHIIRNDSELFRIRRYILDNPKQWQIDRK